MLSVIIPAYNEESCIGQCLEALRKQDIREPFEVIIVDNASTDRTAEIAQSFAGKLSLRVIREEQKGRGMARKTGFSAAKGDILLSTDADCEPPSAWMRSLVEALRSDLSLGGVTTPFTFRDCGVVRNAILNLQWLLMAVYRLLWGHFWLNGSSFAIRREIYDQVGGFNPNANAQEDNELSNRVRRVGDIRCLRHPRMVPSGRRFQKTGLLKGLWAYFSSFVIVRLSRGKKRAELSDVR